ncbi:MAG: hypothetical protein Tsb0020_41050 [Haliangiales bacterium]
MSTTERWFVTALLAGSLWVSGLACGGCGAASKNVEPLDTSVTVYNEGVRWQRFQQAASRLPIEDRDDFLDRRDQLHDDLKIHHYEVIRVRYGPKQLRARVQVKYTWFLESRGVVHETHAVQRWQRDDSFWVMIGEHWLRGEPMPGVPDPETDPDGDPEDGDGDPEDGDGDPEVDGDGDPDADSGGVGGLEVTRGGERERRGRGGAGRSADDVERAPGAGS